MHWHAALWLRDHERRRGRPPPATVSSPPSTLLGRQSIARDHPTMLESTAITRVAPWADGLHREASGSGRYTRYRRTRAARSMAAERKRSWCLNPVAAAAAQFLRVTEPVRCFEGIADLAVHSWLAGGR